MMRRPPRSTLFPTRRSSDLAAACQRNPVLRVGRDPPLPQRAWRVTEHRAAVEALGVPEHGGHGPGHTRVDRKSTRLNSSHSSISYAVFCLKKKKKKTPYNTD